MQKRVADRVQDIQAISELGSESKNGFVAFLPTLNEKSLYHASLSQLLKLDDLNVHFLCKAPSKTLDVIKKSS